LRGAAAVRAHPPRHTIIEQSLPAPRSSSPNRSRKPPTSPMPTLPSISASRSMTPIRSSPGSATPAPSSQATPPPRRSATTSPAPATSCPPTPPPAPGAASTSTPS
jgi:hypothetical protein